jgi:hypothetical protein
MEAQTRFSCAHSACYFMTPLPNARIACSLRSRCQVCLIDANKGTIIQTVTVLGCLEPYGLVTLKNSTFIVICLANDDKIFIWKVDDLTLTKTIDPANCNNYMLALNDGNLP